MRVIGIVGSIGSGKDTVATILAEKLSGQKFDISDVVREEAQQEGITHQRADLTKFAESKLETEGPNYFVQLLADRLQDIRTENVLVSGVRTPANVLFLKQKFGSNFILIAVTISDDEIRHQRIHERGGSKDPDQPEELINNDQIQEEVFRISEAVQMSQYTIDNSAGLAELRQQLDYLAKVIDSSHTSNPI